MESIKLHDKKQREPLIPSENESVIQIRQWNAAHWTRTAVVSEYKSFNCCQRPILEAVKIIGSMVQDSIGKCGSYSQFFQFVGVKSFITTSEPRSELPWYRILTRKFEK